MSHSATWSTRTPLVIEDVSLASYVDLILSKHGPASILVCCMSKETFMNDLFDSIVKDSETITTYHNGSTSDPIEIDSDPVRNASRHHLLIPTLHLLSSSRTLKVFFCPEVVHLLAYLANLGLQTPSPTSDDAKQSLLAILCPIRQHQNDAAFSAQALARFFSLATFAAQSQHSKLVVAECTSPAGSQDDDEDGDLLAFSGAASVWDEEVSLISATTRTFGAGQAGWQGRSVTVRQVAARWCTFISYS